MDWKITGRAISLFSVMAVSFLAPASAQNNPVSLATPAEESLADSSAATIRTNVADERARLLVRLQANTPDQTPGALTTSESELMGQLIANAMGHVLVLQPHGQPVLIAIAPQADQAGNRQLVLLNLSAWIDHGRRLGLNQDEAFAILPDADMHRTEGSSFQVENVAYVGKVEGTSVTFHRNP